jgi:hypothetical protein
VLARETDSHSDFSGNNLLAFAVRCLEFIVPRPQLVRDITLMCCNRLINHEPIRELDEEDHQLPAFLREGPQYLLNGMLTSALENRDKVAEVIKEFVAAQIRLNSTDIAAIALDFAIHIDWALRSSQEEHQATGDVQYWKNVRTDIVQSNTNEIASLSQIDFMICGDALDCNVINLTDLVSWYGIKSLFLPRSYPAFPNIQGAGIAESLLFDIISTDWIDWNRQLPKDSMFQQLRELGSILLHTRTPWLTKRMAQRIFGHFPFHFLMHANTMLTDELTPENNRTQTQVSDPDTLFGMFVLMGLTLEYALESGRALPLVGEVQSVEELEELLRRPLTLPLRDVLLARFSDQEPTFVQRVLDNLGFNFEQQGLMLRWVRRDVNFGSRRRKNFSPYSHSKVEDLE